MHGGADNRPPEPAGLQSVIDSEWQPPGAVFGGAGDNNEHVGPELTTDRRIVPDCSYSAVSNRLGKAAARRGLELLNRAWDGEHGVDNGPPGRARP